GVDVEPTAGEPLSRTVLERCCTPREVDRLCAMPAEQRHAAFVELWTRKEALLKATGQGLRREPNTLSVLDDDDRSIADDASWSYRALDLAAGHAGAVAARGAGWRLACWELAPCS
ncbi:MAG: 4'-phosphopantetheinyl transferase superfamily protein, partial [Gemmatimonadaceae bacterium]